MARGAVISVSVSHQELRVIDAYCEKHGYSRSKLLVRRTIQSIKASPSDDHEVVSSFFGGLFRKNG